MTLEQAIKMTNNIADTAFYAYGTSEKDIKKGNIKPTYLVGDDGRLAIKMVLEALEDKNKNIYANIGGRRDGKTIKIKEELWNELRKLPENRWCGILHKGQIICICKDEFMLKNKIRHKIQELQMKVGTNVECGFSTKYLQYVKVDIDVEIIKVLKKLLEDK